MPSLLFLLMFAAPSARALPAREKAQSCALDLSPIETAIDRVVGPPGAFTRVTKDLLEASDRELSSMTQIPTERRTFKNTVGSLDAVYSRYQREIGAMFSISSLYDVAPAVREEKQTLSAELGGFISRFGANPDYFHIVSRLRGLSGDDEELRLAWLRDFEDAGANLDAETRRKITALVQDVSPTATAYFQSRENDQSEIVLPARDLRGVPNLPATGDVHLPLGSLPEVQRALAYAQDPAVRERIYLAHRNRLPDNAKRLLAITKANAMEARLKGYPSRLDVTASGRSVAGSPAKIEKLLQRMADGMKGPIRVQLDALRALKAAEDPDGGDLRPWDVDYYERVSQSKNAADHVADVGEAFPADQMFDRVTTLLGRLFELEFREVRGAKTWDPSVRLVEVYDLRAGRLLGGLYIDLFSRAGKPAGGAYVSTLQHRRPGVLPLAILSTNWGAPGEHAFLDHGTLFTLFHEFGHALHLLFAESRSPVTAFNAFPTDFVEMPSTTFEYLAKDPAVLVELSRGALDLEKARRLAHASLGFRLTQGDFYSTTYGLNTVFLSLLDIDLQKAAPTMTSPKRMHAIYRRKYREFFEMDPGPEDHFTQNFFHVGGGYAGKYWSYLMARTMAANVFERLTELGGLTNPAALRTWREMVLNQPQHSRTALEILETFLGHELQAEPLLREQGLL